MLEVHASSRKFLYFNLNKKAGSVLYDGTLGAMQQVSRELAVVVPWQPEVIWRQLVEPAGLVLTFLLDGSRKTSTEELPVKIGPVPWARKLRLYLMQAWLATGGALWVAWMRGKGEGWRLLKELVEELKKS